MLTVFCLCNDFTVCVSMKEAEVSHLFQFIWDKIYEADPAAVKIPLFVKSTLPQPPAFFTVSSFIKITLALLEQPYFIGISHKRMSQTI